LLLAGKYAILANKKRYGVICVHIWEKLQLDYDGLIEHGPITIVAFGDSVTHGSVSGDEINYETAYWNRLKQKLNAVRNYVPVNVINAGIGGITAAASLGRMQRQVLAHDPDLVIVCFGLNDVNGPLEEYLDALREIFTRCTAQGIDTVFMTPNMLNTYVPEDTPKEHWDYAHVTAEVQNGGRMDRYMQAAIEVANETGAMVCDCYSAWKKLAETEDTTMLLANRINHPTSEMHELFADKLFKLIMEGGEKRQEGDDGMINLARS
jgi:lysophospholipase L1-like esterase